MGAVPSFAAFLSGAGALALQIAWTRQLSLVLGGSTYAFSAMLLVVLAGIGLGSLVFHLGLKGAREPRKVQAVAALVLLAATVLGQRVIEPLILLVGALGPFRGSPTWNGAVCVFTACALELLPSMGMGILLPLYAAASGKGAVDAGRTVGDLYAWNTAGTLVGALGAALFLLPGFSFTVLGRLIHAGGASFTVAAALALYLLSALLLFPARTSRSRLSLAAIAIAGLIAVVLSSRGPDPFLMNLGTFMYGGRSFRPESQFHPLFIEEGISTNVMVTGRADGVVSLRVNGKVDASNSLDMPMQAGSAYFPRFFRPAARDVLVIGFGSGTTSGASLLFPETRVTCAEIEPAVARASSYFEKVNHKPLESPRFRLVLNDGRCHLQGSKEKYDIIVSEPSNPWMAGLASLFTREFYLAARERLSPGGVLAQWIQTYSLTPPDYALIVRTILQVFPHGTLIRMPGTDTILIASAATLDPSRAGVEEAQRLVDSVPDVKADLERLFGSGDVRSLLLGHRFVGEEGLRRFVELDGGKAIQTDLDLRLEFVAPLRLFDPDVFPAAVRRSILAASDTAALRDAWERWGCGQAHLPVLKDILDFLAANDAWEPAQELLELGLRIDPDDAHLVAARFMSSMPADEAAWNEGLSRILTLSPEEAAKVGVWLHLGRDYDRALRVWRRLLEAHPQAATLWINLGASLEAKGEKDASRKAGEKARALDPFSSFVRSSVEASTMREVEGAAAASSTAGPQGAAEGGGAAGAGNAPR